MANIFQVKIIAILAILFIASLKWSYYFLALDGITIFFLFLLIASSVIGTLLLYKVRSKYYLISTSGKKLYFVLLAVWLLNIAFARELPLINVIGNTGSYYKDIGNISTIYPLIMVLSCYLGIMSWYSWLCCGRTVEIIKLIFVLSIIVLSMGTAAFMVVFFSCFFISLIYLNKNIVRLIFNPKRSAKVLLSIFLISIVFTGWKEVRSVSNAKLNEGNLKLERTISDFGGATSAFFDTGLHEGVFWIYSYSVSPVFNLDSALKHDTSFNTCDHQFLTRSMLPQSVQNRMLGIHELPRSHLVNPLFNVSTAYFIPYYYCGWGGIIIFIFLVNALYFLGFTLVRSSPFLLPYIGLVCTIEVLSFFGSILILDIVFVPLIMMVMFAIINRTKWRHKFA